MKKQHTLSLLLVAAGALLGACASDDSDSSTNEQKSQHSVVGTTYQAEVVASLPADLETRAFTITDAETAAEAISVNWDEDDELYVINYENKSTGCLKLSDIEDKGNEEAALSGSLTTQSTDDLIKDATVTLRYPRVTKEYTGQVGTLADIEANYAYAEATSTVVSNEGGIVKIAGKALVSQQAIMRFTFNVAVKEVTIWSTVISSGTPITITPADPTATVYAALPVTDDEASPVTIFFKATIDNTGAPYVGSKTLSTNIQNGIYYKGSVTLAEPYVNLGLTSGTKWAAMNVGAITVAGSVATCTGYHYAWGEPEPYYTCKSPLVWRSGKTAYDMGNYTRFGTYDSGASPNYGFTKYTTTDSKTVLEAVDDAATANWGSDWCTPTKTQWDELISQCTWTRLSLALGYSINGYKVTGPNGRYIILPAAGDFSTNNNRDGKSIQWENEYGLYWTSTVGDNKSCAQSFYFLATGGPTMHTGHLRSFGFAVRPVRQ